MKKRAFRAGILWQWLVSTQKKSRLRISKDSVTGRYLSVCVGSRIGARRRNAAMVVAATQAHSPAGFNRMVAVAGLLTCSASWRLLGACRSNGLVARGCVCGTYSSGYCSGLSPDSLLIPLCDRLFGLRDTIAPAKLQLFPHTPKIIVTRPQSVHDYRGIYCMSIPYCIFILRFYCGGLFSIYNKWEKIVMIIGLRNCKDLLPLQKYEKIG